MMDFVEHVFLTGSQPTETASAILPSQSPKPKKTVWKWVPQAAELRKNVKFGNQELFQYLLEFEEDNPCECCFSVEQSEHAIVPVPSIYSSRSRSLSFCGPALHLPR